MDALGKMERIAESKQGRMLFRIAERGENLLMLELRENAGTMCMMQPIKGMVLSRYETRIGGFNLDTTGVGAGMKLNYCTAGRLEAAMRDDRFLYLAPGGLSVETSTATKFSFPCGFYRGVELFLPQEFLARPPRFLAEAGIDLSAVLAAACPARMPNWVRNASSEATRILDALAVAPGSQWPARERLLVAQLLLLLAAEGAPLRETDTTIYTKSQVDIAKRTCEALCANLARRRSVDDVARELGIGATTCKNLFKGVYGQSVSDFMAERRMESACAMLAHGTAPVAEVARAVGYANPGKFAAAFKAHIGETPHAWRAERAGARTRRR